ncbi:MAG: hypothetical protein QXI12_10745 [Candidatus Methanomethyliaceae archaeon]
MLSQITSLFGSFGGLGGFGGFDPSGVLSTLQGTMSQIVYTMAGAAILLMAAYIVRMLIYFVLKSFAGGFGAAVLSYCVVGLIGYAYYPFLLALAARIGYVALGSGG